MSPGLLKSAWATEGYNVPRRPAGHESSCLVTPALRRQRQKNQGELDTHQLEFHSELQSPRRYVETLCFINKGLGLSWWPTQVQGQTSL